jgi:glycerol-3-phosphate dehydrogenase (NAD(P)+)
VVSVIGSGSWATAMVKLMQENKVKVKWWVKNKERQVFIKQQGFNPNYLSGVQINTRYVKPSINLKKDIKSSEIVVLAIPAAFIAEVLKELPKDIFEGKIIVTAIKGMIPEENLLVSDFVKKEFGVTDEQLTVVAGPCHAEEIAMSRQSYLTIGGSSHISRELVAALYRGVYVRVDELDDLEGIEYSAVMKNIIALSCGIAHGLNFGDNFQAVLVSNAMQEIRVFLNRYHPKDRDLFHSAYLGDVLVTAYSQFSRNRTFGGMIGRGYTVKSALLESKMVSEGYYAVKCMFEKFDLNELEMPVCKAVYQILYEKVSPAIEFQILKDKFS